MIEQLLTLNTEKIEKIMVNTDRISRRLNSRVYQEEISKKVKDIISYNNMNLSYIGLN